jgi:hypothetical protein
VVWIREPDRLHADAVAVTLCEGEVGELLVDLIESLLEHLQLGVDVLGLWVDKRLKLALPPLGLRLLSGPDQRCEDENDCCKGYPPTVRREPFDRV